MSRPWRLAQSLETLRDQINDLAPGRDKSSDGTIGDAAHRARKSDHNPDRDGVVRALDITHDPASGVDCRQLAERLRQARDTRILYVIDNGRIFSSRVSPWEWRAYRGSNPHTKHMHVSVVADRARYDDARPWHVVCEPMPADQPAHPRNTVRLRRGDEGAAVRELQNMLDVPRDGIFGVQTEAAVRAFQAGHGLVTDGIVGPYTWDALLRKGDSSDAQVMRGITATVFGGTSDPNRSAYDNHVITDDELGVALPWRFPDERPLVRVVHDGRAVIAPIIDVGPWNTDDPYWQTGSRPQAEDGRDRRGRTTNMAGIDLTPAAATAIGLPGKGLVDWQFVGAAQEQPEPTSPWPPATGVDNILAEIADLIRPVLEQHIMPQVSAFYRPSEADWNEMLKLLKKQAASAPAPLSFIDKVLGGKLLVGKKTISGIIGLIATLAGVKTGVADPQGVWVEVLTWVFTGLAGAGFTAKIDRALKLGIEYLPKILNAIATLSEAITKQQSQHAARQP